MWGKKELNTKSKFILTFKFFSSCFARSSVGRFIGFPIRLAYKLIVQWCLGVDLPDQVKLGKGCRLYHGVGIVVHKDVQLGDNVTLRHGTTIGERTPGGGVPRIGNNVDIGAHVLILGDVNIGDNVKLGAGCVVFKLF